MVAVVICVFVVVVGLTSLLAVASTRLMGRVMGQSMHDRLKAAEHIVRTHQAPPAWTGPLHAGVDPGGQAAERMRAGLVRRLERLIDSLKGAPIFQDDNARKVLLGELGRARQEWLTKPLTVLVGLESPARATGSVPQPRD